METVADVDMQFDVSQNHADMAQQKTKMEKTTRNVHGWNSIGIQG